jgi:hypothetical protein
LVWYASQPVECAYTPEFVISVCEIVHAICIAHTVYVWTISDYMHSESIFNFSPQSLVMTVFFSSLIAACSMLMYSVSGISSLSRLSTRVLAYQGHLDGRRSNDVLTILVRHRSFAQKRFLFIIYLLMQSHSHLSHRTRALADKLIVWAISLLK